MSDAGAERKCWNGSLPAAIGGGAENICSSRKYHLHVRSMHRSSGLSSRYRNQAVIPSAAASSFTRETLLRIGTNSAVPSNSPPHAPRGSNRYLIRRKSDSGAPAPFRRLGRISAPPHTGHGAEANPRPLPSSATGKKKAPVTAACEAMDSSTARGGKSREPLLTSAAVGPSASPAARAQRPQSATNERR